MLLATVLGTDNYFMPLDGKRDGRKGVWSIVTGRREAACQGSTLSMRNEKNARTSN